MWQDALVTIVALAAIGGLGWRSFKARTKPEGSCPSCASGDPCKPPGPAQGQTRV